MGATRIYFVATVLLFVLNGACLVEGAATDSMTTSYSTSDGTSTSGMNNGNTTTAVPADNSAKSNKPDSGAGLMINKIGTSKTNISCLVCQGGNNSNCSHASATSDMEDIIEQRGCRSCSVSMTTKSDTGKGTNITQVERKCDQTDSCPEDNFKCFHYDTYSTCEWCCVGNNCNGLSWNSANALVAAVVLGGWTITKVVYVVVSTVAVAISMSILV